jgi:hypothetical protein
MLSDVGVRDFVADTLEIEGVKQIVEQFRRVVLLNGSI